MSNHERAIDDGHAKLAGKEWPCASTCPTC